MNKYILIGMSKAFFATAWSSQAEEADMGLVLDSMLSGCDIMNVIPVDIDPAAINAAKTLYMDFESKLGLQLDGAYIQIHGINCMTGDTDCDKAESFGHYTAMQSMGHGVGLFDYGVISQIQNNVPFVEFGSHSLEKDYF